MKLIHCFPLPTDNIGISYTALSIFRAQRDAGLDVEFVTPVVRRNAFGLGISQCGPFLYNLIPWSRLKDRAGECYAKVLLSRAAPGVVFDLWSNHSADLVRQLQAKGAKVVAEKFNCHQGYARRILNSEYERMGMSKRCAITDESIASENTLLRAVDFIISPSPMVRQSLVHSAHGYDPDKIIDSSFGWDPQQLTNTDGPDLSAYPSPRFLFVGSVEIRKGAHLLLDYWKEAGINGTLIFMGAVRDELRPIIEQINAPNAVFLGHLEKAFGVYNQADVFVFPSLEEGSPLVTYEATARGLPCIVSPMGAGGATSTGMGAMVIDPHDRRGWVQSFGTMARSVRYTAGIKRLADRFTWANVAAQRYEAIRDKIKNEKS